MLQGLPLAENIPENMKNKMLLLEHVVTSVCIYVFFSLETMPFNGPSLVAEFNTILSISDKW